jgi:carboxymethylenebutenolidase
MSEFIDIATPDGTFRAYVETPSAPKAPAIVVLQEIFGINEDMKETCAWLASEGFIAVCPDLFWRIEPGVSMSSLNEAEWKKGFEFYQRFNRDLGVADIAATIEAARKLPKSTGRVGVTGFCLGGLMTFLTAARKSPEAAVAYYGGETDKYIDEARGLTRPLMMHLGEADEFINAAAREKIIASVKGNPHVTVYTYPGSMHAFARHHGVHYDETAATAANGRTIAFFKKHLA